MDHRGGVTSGVRERILPLRSYGVLGHHQAPIHYSPSPGPPRGLQSLRRGAEEQRRARGCSRFWKYSENTHRILRNKQQQATLNFDPNPRQTFLPLRSEANKQKRFQYNTITVGSVEVLAVEILEMLSETQCDTGGTRCGDAQKALGDFGDTGDTQRGAGF